MINETTNIYYSILKELVNQSKVNGKNISNRKIVEKILISVTKKYDSIATIIKKLKNIYKLLVTKLMNL